LNKQGKIESSKIEQKKVQKLNFGEFLNFCRFFGGLLSWLRFADGRFGGVTAWG
jgi:hypothetical protein